MESAIHIAAAITNKSINILLLLLCKVCEQWQAKVLPCASRKCGLPAKNAKTQWIFRGTESELGGSFHEKNEHKPIFYACRQDLSSAD